MKKKYIISIIVVIGFYGFLYFWNQEVKSIEKHPTIHDAAAKPDAYLLEAEEFEAKNRHDKSANSIEQAILAIWKLEKDVDDASFERLEQTVKKLEAVHGRIIRDSIPSEELLTAFEYALGNLARAELEVAEKYSASNQTVEARSALIYAQLHIKNALLLHQSLASDDAQTASEKIILSQMDSLLAQKDLSQPDYFSSLNKLMKEVDEVINMTDQE